MFEINIPAALAEKKNASLLTGIMRGVEREALRVDGRGNIALTPHPTALGKALTHPQITTDFSEALLEFITPPTHCVDDLFTHLNNIHQFTRLALSEEELLWMQSMPCAVGEDASVPLAQYGHSNNGLMKTVYRHGLGLRYGRTMQTVSGVHYNFSLPNAFWAFLSMRENSSASLQDYKDERYFAMIRNFRRHYWLLIYLFGASPALCSSFVANRPHDLDQHSDNHTLYLPFATSLRMGDLGYQSTAQESLYVCYDTKLSYIKSLCCAITRSHADYEKFGTKDNAGNYLQLNTSLLQIENEFYSAIRPKRTAKPGETALSALQNRGVEYIEVRCLDIDPFTPLGISMRQVRFLDTFLLYCILADSPAADREESDMILSNQKAVVRRGRDPDLQLHYSQGSDSLTSWANKLVYAMKPLAQLLDDVSGTDEYLNALEEQQQKIDDPATTPSARILDQINTKNLSFAEFGLEISKRHDDSLRSSKLLPATISRMEKMAQDSIGEQHKLEQSKHIDFEHFLTQYYRQYQSCSGKNAKA